MKTLISIALFSLSLSSFGSSSLDSCIQSIKVIQTNDVKVSQLEKNAVKSLKSCFKDLKAAEKSRQKELKLAARKEKQRKSLEAKILKLQEKLKKS
jgi:lipoate-protein ligase A